MIAPLEAAQHLTVHRGKITLRKPEHPCLSRRFIRKSARSNSTFLQARTNVVRTLGKSCDARHHHDMPQSNVNPAYSPGNMDATLSLINDGYHPGMKPVLQDIVAARRIRAATEVRYRRILMADKLKSEGCMVNCTFCDTVVSTLFVAHCDGASKHVSLCCERRRI